MMRWTVLAGLAGLSLAIGLVAWQGLDDVAAAFELGGVALLWPSLFHAVPMALNAHAWRVLLPRGPSLARMTMIVWVRESVNGLLPVARVGGEVVSARLLVQARVRTTPAVASLVVDMTLALVTQFLFTLIGVGLLAARTDDGAIVTKVALIAAAALPLVVALGLAQRVGLFELLARLVRVLFGDRWAAFTRSSARLDRSVRVLYQRRLRAFSCAAWQLAGWIVGAGEIWLALRVLRHPISIGDAVLLEAMAQAVSSAAFIVPGALGVQEGGFLLFGGLIGLGPDVALALALARRVRDLVVFLPGLIAWQVSEGRRVWG